LGISSLIPAHIFASTSRKLQDRGGTIVAAYSVNGNLDEDIFMSAKRISFHRILCPTDLSRESDEAIRYAAGLARAYGSHLLVCHCVGPRMAVGPATDRIKRRIEGAVGKYLRAGRGPLPHWEALVVAGDPADSIPRVAAERGVDLIAMRSRRRPYAAALLGSTAESLCRTAPCPVLVTHQQEREWIGRSTNEVDLRRVLVAHDFSSDSELAVGYAISLSEEYQSEIHCLHVLEPSPWPQPAPTPWSTSATEQAFEEAARRLHNSIPPEARNWCEVKHVINQGQPYREILNYAEENDIDLICMGVQGTGFGMRALFGSNVDRVLRQAPCPVLIARPLKPAVTAKDNDELLYAIDPGQSNSHAAYRGGSH
jgi:nucleotide-binding universal stress UspA family protein